MKISPALTCAEEQRFLYYFYEAQRLFEAEDYQKSFELMQFCYKLHPNDAMVCQYLGDFYAGMNRKDVALAFFEQAKKHDTKNEGIWPRLLECYISLRLLEQAIAAQDEIDRINGYDVYSALNRYRIFAMKGDGQNAIKAVNDYLDVDPANVQFLVFRVQLLEAIPNVKYKQKVMAYEQLLAADPYNIMAMNNYAYLLATHKGDLKKAEALSRHTIQMEPNNPIYLDTYAWILYLQGEQKLAEFYIQQAQLQMGNQQEEEINQHYNAIMQHKK